MVLNKVTVDGLCVEVLWVLTYEGLTFIRLENRDEHRI